MLIYQGSDVPQTESDSWIPGCLVFFQDSDTGISDKLVVVFRIQILELWIQNMVKSSGIAPEVRVDHRRQEASSESRSATLLAMPHCPEGQPALRLGGGRHPRLDGRPADVARPRLRAGPFSRIPMVEAGRSWRFCGGAQGSRDEGWARVFGWD